MAQACQNNVRLWSSIMKEHEVYHLGKTEVTFSEQGSAAPEDIEHYSGVCACILCLHGSLMPPAVGTADDAAHAY